MTGVNPAYQPPALRRRSPPTPPSPEPPASGECGAVIGGLMVLGLEYGMAEAYDSDAFQNTFEKVGAFVEKFKEHHGNLNCQQLIGLNVFSEEGLKEFMDKDIKLTQCVKYVEDAVKIVEEIINQD